MNFIKQVSGRPGSGKAKTVFCSGATSDDLQCAQFFMKMQDEGKSIEDASAYARIGHIVSPSVDWSEINRVLATFNDNG